jgi:subtilisin family serine protease
MRMRQVKALAASAVLALAVTAAANSASLGGAVGDPFFRPAVGGVGAPASSPAGARASARAWPRGEATVGYRNHAALRAALARFPARVVTDVRALHSARVRPAGDVARFAANVARLPGITFVERLATREQSIDPALLLPAGRTVPWEWQYSVTGADGVSPWVQRAAAAITIAVVDTGADFAAPDLAAKEPTGFNERTSSSDVRDTIGHGTFVSALAAGSVTNDDGIAGFGGDAKLLVVKAGGGDGSFTDLEEANAIVYAVDQGARIINLSLGGPTTSVTERRAIDYAAEHGVLVVAAAGNEYWDGNPVEYPAALLQPVGSHGVGGRGLAVGASTMSGSRAQFSNVGSYISLLAPGENVFSAVSSASSPFRFPRVTLPGASGQYGFASGTSFSAPEVAGAAALVWAANPLLDAQGVAEILKATASNGGTWTAELGWGVLDVAAAVSRAAGTPAARTAYATVSLKASVVRHRATVTATLRSSAPGIGTTGRVVSLEVWDGSSWRATTKRPTSAAGAAVFSLKLRSGTHRVRVRWGGAADLSGAVSAPVKLRG